MTMIQRHSVHRFVIALVVAVVIAGTAFAVAQVTRNVAATVNVQVVAPDGVEIYMDAGLTQVATSIGFGTVEVDPFGTSRGLVPVSVWIKNQSLTAVKLTLGDNFADADVVLEGVAQPPVLQPNDVLPGTLTLDFHPGVAGGPTAFTVSFHADGLVAGPTPVQVPSPKGAVGAIMVAVFDIPPSTGLGSSQLADMIHYIGVGEVTFQATVNNSAAPMLATGFTLRSDLSSGTLTIRDDVIFHGQGLPWAESPAGGWGPMTAADIAYTINDGNNAINNNSIHWQAGDFVTMFGANPIVVVNSTTLAFTFSTRPGGTPNFDPRWNANLLNDAAQAFSVQSTAVRDAKGETWMRDHPLIATGPYHILEWVQDDRLVVEAIPYDHWSGRNAQVARLTLREVGAESTRVALMATGEVDAAFISTKNIPPMLAGGFKTVDNGLKNLVSVIFSGNVWEKTHVISGQPLDTAAVYMRDLPWIGNPLNVDTRNQTLATAIASAQAGTLTDFEEATLVRNALARAYDRDLINQAVQAGLGFPSYLNQFSPTNPNWQAKWEYPFDQAESARLLDLAGWPLRNGVRFEMPLFAPSPGDDQEIADAVAGFFDEIGVITTVQKFSYSVYRPGLVARATTLPWVSQCDDGKSTWPWDWPKSQDHTSLTRGGFGCGIEIPVVAEGWVAAVAEPDPAKRILINNAVAEYLFTQAISPGVVGQPAPITYNPLSIAAWPMNPALFAPVTDYESIVPAAR